MVSMHTAAATAVAMGLGCAASANVVTISQTFYNNTSSAKTYEYMQYAPLAAGMTSGMMSGSVTATLTDLTGNGANLTSSGGFSVYTATINDQSVYFMWNAPFNYNVGNFLSGSTAPSTFANVLTPAGVPIDGNLAVVLRFTLSAGDAVSFASTFTVVPVPAPGAAALLGIAGASAFGRRRRA